MNIPSEPTVGWKLLIKRFNKLIRHDGRVVQVDILLAIKCHPLGVFSSKGTQYPTILIFLNCLKLKKPFGIFHLFLKHFFSFECQQSQIALKLVVVSDLKGEDAAVGIMAIGPSVGFKSSGPDQYSSDFTVR